MTLVEQELSTLSSPSVTLMEQELSTLSSPSVTLVEQELSTLSSQSVTLVEQELSTLSSPSVTLVEQELYTLSSPSVLGSVGVTQSLVFRSVLSTTVCIFSWSLYIVCPSLIFGFWLILPYFIQLNLITIRSPHLLPIFYRCFVVAAWKATTKHR